MGASESNPETTGWRILEVIPDGPCWDKGLCVYFDFIVGINGVRLNTSSEEFWDIIRSKQDIEIVLTVFNYKTRLKRDILMTPNNNWKGDGLLGLVIVKDDFTLCDQQCIRVLTVDKSSPADKAGLIPSTDYILGTPINAFTTFNLFRETISDYIDQPLPIYVYNAAQATVRLVEIKPSSAWHGDGVLGCQVGDGYLHHIPSLTDEQEEIIFKPNSCYVVSSKNSSKTQRPQQTQSQSNDDMKQSQSQNQSQAQAQTDTISERKVDQESLEQVQNQMQDMNIGQGQVQDENVNTQNLDVNNNENDEEVQELPKIRWTHSSNKIDPMAAHHDEDEENVNDQEEEVDVTPKVEYRQIKSNPTQNTHNYSSPRGMSRLQQLEQETQQVLSQQNE